MMSKNLLGKANKAAEQLSKFQPDQGHEDQHITTQKVVEVAEDLLGFGKHNKAEDPHFENQMREIPQHEEPEPQEYEEAEQDDPENEDPEHIDPHEHPEHMDEGQQEEDQQQDEEDFDPNKDQNMIAPEGRFSMEDEIPSDKDALIEYLRSKLEKTQVVIDEAFDHLQNEKKITANMLLELDDHKSSLKQIQQSESRPVKEKIHQKVEETLEKVVQQKVEAENIRNELKDTVNERQMLYDELESRLISLQQEDEEKQKQLLELQNKISNYDSQIEELTQNQHQLKDEAVQKDQEIKQLLKEREDMRGVMAKLSDTRNVLNRQLANPEELYANGGFESKQSPNRSEENKKKVNVQSNGLLPNIKKQNYLVNEDDFWFADPAKQPYAKDYGGKDNNYNEQYKYNMQIQNKQSDLRNNPQVQNTDDIARKSLSSKFDSLPQIHGVQNLSKSPTKKVY